MAVHRFVDHPLADAISKCINHHSGKLIWKEKERWIESIKIWHSNRARPFIVFVCYSIYLIRILMELGKGREANQANSNKSRCLIFDRLHIVVFPIYSPVTFVWFPHVECDTLCLPFAIVDCAVSGSQSNLWVNESLRLTPVNQVRYAMTHKRPPPASQSSHCRHPPHVLTPLIPISICFPFSHVRRDVRRLHWRLRCPTRVVRHSVTHNTRHTPSDQFLSLAHTPKSTKKKSIGENDT